MLNNLGNKKKNEKKGENNKDVTGLETKDDHLQYSNSLENFIFSTENLGVDGLVKQYRKLDAQQDPSLTYDAYTKNMRKNRYCDVVCLDNSRVKLKIDKSRHGDYIHANYVKTNYLRSTFICSQGPLQHTIIDFWRMVFQERAESILLLCKVGRAGRPRYWPSLGLTETYGCIRVTNMGESSDEFEICNLAVTFVPDNVLADEQPENLKELRVSLIKWPNWPDCGVPDEKCHTVPQRLLAQVRHGPCVVHCSAGIGRTGCVMSLELAYNKLKKKLNVDFEEIVTELRKKRAQCIETEIQYLYIHSVIMAFAREETGVSEKALAAADAFLRFYNEYLERI